MQNFFSLACFLFFLTNPSCLLADPAILDFSNKVIIDGTELVLNGQAMRRASIFRVKVYAMGLYLEEKESDPGKIIQSRDKKFIKMKVLRDLSIKELLKAWTEGIVDNYPDYRMVQKELQIYNNAMIPVKKGDEFTLFFDEDILELALNNKASLQIKSYKFQEALLSIWFGSNPPSQKLKQNLLKLE